MNFEEFVHHPANQVIQFVYGFLGFIACILISIIHGDIFFKPSENIINELALERRKLWSLDEKPFGLTHKFCTLDDGFRFHYLINDLYGDESKNSAAVKSRSRNLVIFIHGFPDSCFVWKRQMTSTTLNQRATLIAVDIPGYGGSDSLLRYDPEYCLEYVSQFVLRMRRQYLSNPLKDKVIICGHDWGALITFRLASEAPQLADRFIINNCFYGPLTFHNARARLQESKILLGDWLKNPRQFGKLIRCFRVLKPVVNQLSRSWYIMLFRTPSFLIKQINKIGHFSFVRKINEQSDKPNLLATLKYSKEQTERLASSLGPDEEQCKPSVVRDQQGTKISTGEVYSTDVQLRAPSGGWMHRLGVYRNNLGFGKWKPSKSTQRELDKIWASKNWLTDKDTPMTAFKAPMTVIWFEKDLAIDRTLSLENIDQGYFTGNSQVLVVPQFGHWGLTKPIGGEVVTAVIEWALEGQGTGKLNDWKGLKELKSGAEVTVDYA